MESSQCLFEGLVLQPSGFGPVVRQAFWTWSLCGSLSSLGLLSQVLPGCDTTNCAVPGKGSHNNTIRTLERSLLAADTDGYADTESGTSHECAVRVPKGLQRLEHYVLTHNLSQVDLSAAWTGQQRFQGGERRRRPSSSSRRQAKSKGPCKRLLFSLLRSGLRGALRGPAVVTLQS